MDPAAFSPTPRALALASSAGPADQLAPWALAEAQAGAARSCEQVGTFGTAVTLFESALRWSSLGGAVDASVDLLCELVETLARESDQLEAYPALL